jgi:prepilin-type N-terminal cleavage/methylation domain-containing protein
MRRRCGFTLLEVLVAAAVLSVGLIGTMELVSQCAKSSRGIEERARALLFARSKLEEILKEPVIQLGTDRGQGVDETTDFDWEMSIDQGPVQDLYVVTTIARHRVSGVTATLSAMRRADISAPTESGTTLNSSSGRRRTTAGGT